ncbi:hypothetical protein [Allosalinactinospora lopnorensis]|uniref:hypothetical protein n=1 Tax=Allosalinactinospora lopnorensis TaxID=1352348 RepID=UPI0012E1F988|nr:hypothetical protein [Allosalinactinospora lopnorensis]
MRRRPGEVAGYYDPHAISDAIAEAELERHELQAAEDVMIVSSIRLPETDHGTGP